MKKIAERIESKGFVYVQEWRNNKWAIYQQWLDNELIAYELIKIRKNKEHIIAGKIFPVSESYPTDKSWGKEGWTFHKLADAKKRLIEYEPELANLFLSK